MSAYNREVGIRRSPPALGASGSVNASVIFNILYSPYSTVLIYGILPMPAWALGGLWLAYDINGAMVRLFPVPSSWMGPRHTKAHHERQRFFHCHCLLLDGGVQPVAAPVPCAAYCVRLESAALLSSS